MSWADTYVGLPWALNGRTEKGVDCWGIVVLAARRELGVEVPDWTSDGESAKAAAAAFLRGIETEQSNAVRTDQWDDWGLVVVRRRGLPHHVGLVVRGGVLHSVHGQGVIWQSRSRFVADHENDEVEVWTWHALSS